MAYTLGLIGYPVSHSLSPRIHTAALRALELEGSYTAIPVPPDQLPETLRELVANGYTGLNVTIPHKQTVMPLMAELSVDARAIGAVNTIVAADGRLRGHNTDGTGFLRGLAEAGFAPGGQDVLVLGAGGAARAVVYSLKQAGARITIWNRTAQRAAGLAREFGVQFAANGASAGLSGAWDLIVNTTSAGMTPHGDVSPVCLSADGLSARWVYDLVYNPRETVLLGQARAAGAQAIGGIAMLVYQAAESFRLWTGCEPPVSFMLQAVAND
jgi:shikimate dehydrogenase